MPIYNADHARADLRDILDNAKQGQPSMIARWNRPEAVIVGLDDWHELQAFRALQGERVDSSEVDKIMAAAGVDIPPVPANVAS
jgi:prevent-host-death family protein